MAPTPIVPRTFPRPRSGRPRRSTDLVDTLPRVRTIDWQDRIGRDEQVLWTGAPEPGFRFRLIDIPLSLFGLVFAAIGGSFALASFPFGLLIPHLWVGLYIAFGRFIVERIFRESTGYAVTDRRAMIVRTWPSRRSTDINVHALAGLDLIEHRDGTGTIRFSAAGARGWWDRTRSRQSANWANPNRGGPAFEYIKHPHRVLEILRSLQAAPPGTGSASAIAADPPWPVTYGTPPDPFDEAALAEATGATMAPEAPTEEPSHHGPFWRPPDPTDPR